MFNVGDRVVRIHTTGSEKDPGYNYGVKGTVTKLDACEPNMDCMVLTDNYGEILWNYEYMILEEVFESPLYKAMREE